MSSYNKNLVFTAACIGMCFFGISMITLGSVLPSLTTKLGLDNLQATALVTFLPLGLLGGSLLFGPIVDRFGSVAAAQLSGRVARTGRNCFLYKYPIVATFHYRNRPGRRDSER